MNTNQWLEWTDKSKDISFKSRKNGIGDGEYKVAKELNTNILGQNSNYDIDININNKIYEADIKKLDKNTFNTGVNGRNKIIKLKNNLKELFLNCENIYNNYTNFTDNDKIIIKKIITISPDEICESNIKNIKYILNVLNKKKLSIQQLHNINSKIYHPITKELIEVNINIKYQILELLNMELNDKEKEIYFQIKILKYFEHQYIDNPNLFTDELNLIKDIFIDKILIFVDNKNGYYIMTEPNKQVNFIRITRGCPRFQVNI